MKYNVSINEKSKTVTVEIDGGYKGVAKCCEGDSFNLGTGIELALERAKVAKANAEKPKSATAKSGDVMELVKALEKALPKGEMVVVGNGDKMTEENKEWLRWLVGDCKCKCKCEDEYYTADDLDEAVDEAYQNGHDDGYDEGYDNGISEATDEAYEEGYQEGYARAIEEMQDTLDDMRE